MNRIFGFIAIAAGVAFFSVNASAEEYKLGYVNTAKILAEANAAKQAQNKLESEFSKREGDLKKLQARVQTLQTSLDKDSATLTDTVRRDRERELSDATRDFQRMQREFREDLITARNDALKLLQDRANKAIESIAKSQNFDLIVQEPVVYASKKIDITDQVIKALDAAK